MIASVSNRLREVRQALYSIETNRYKPNVTLALRLAEAWLSSGGSPWDGGP